jgi:hypothetical protein
MVAFSWLKAVHHETPFRTSRPRQQQLALRRSQDGEAGSLGSGAKGEAPDNDVS